MPIHRRVISLSLLLLLLASAPPALAEQPAESVWQNPFASRLDPHPGRLVLNLHVASLHGDGVGVAVGGVPWGFFEAKLSYAYGTEHTVAGQLKFNLLPRAALTPYLPLGYSLGISKLPYGLSLLTHRAFAGLGLQARILSRFFLAGEVTANVDLYHHLKDQSRAYDFPPSEYVSIRAGFLVGAYLL